MDIRNLLPQASARMRSRFIETSVVHHPKGKGDNREDIIREQLKEVVPHRYSLAHGEIVTSSNRHSNEMDVIIIDGDHCPHFLLEGTHALVPIEVV